VPPETAKAWIGAFQRLARLWYSRHISTLFSGLDSDVLPPPADYGALLDALLFRRLDPPGPDAAAIGFWTDAAMERVGFLLQRRLPTPNERDLLARLVDKLDTQPKARAKVGGGPRSLAAKVQSAIVTAMVRSPFAAPVPVQMGAVPLPQFEFTVLLRNWIRAIEKDRGEPDREMDAAGAARSSSSSEPEATLAPVQSSAAEQSSPAPETSSGTSACPYRLEKQQLRYGADGSVHLEPKQAACLKLLIEAYPAQVDFKVHFQTLPYYANHFSALKRLLAQKGAPDHISTPRLSAVDGYRILPQPLPVKRSA
jgi:hypothetical protein